MIAVASIPAPVFLVFALGVWAGWCGRGGFDRASRQIDEAGK